jgi:hypothetical protein
MASFELARKHARASRIWLLPGALDTLVGALADQATLELGNSTHDGKHQPAGIGRSERTLGRVDQHRPLPIPLILEFF